MLRVVLVCSSSPTIRTATLHSRSSRERTCFTCLSFPLHLFDSFLHFYLFILFFALTRFSRFLFHRLSLFVFFLQISNSLSTCIGADRVSFVLFSDRQGYCHKGETVIRAQPKCRDRMTEPHCMSSSSIIQTWWTHGQPVGFAHFLRLLCCTRFSMLWNNIERVKTKIWRTSKPDEAASTCNSFQNRGMCTHTFFITFDFWCTFHRCRWNL